MLISALRRPCKEQGQWEAIDRFYLGRGVMSDLTFGVSPWLQLENELERNKNGGR